MPASPAPAKPPEVEEWVDERIHRPLARRVVALLLHTPITPNQVTLLSGIVGVSGGVVTGFAVAWPAGRLLGAALLFAAVVLDCCDGQLARARKISSTYGAILDGIADYAVGIALGVGAGFYMAATFGSPWYWLLALAGIASSAVQSALFDHTKSRYIARAGAGYSEREEDLGAVRAERDRAWRERRLRDALLLALYHNYSTVQHAALQIAPAADPAAYRAANAGRMRAWTLLGIGTHFALGYVLLAASYWWPAAIAVYFALCTTVLNLYLVVLMRLEARQAAA
ncbi:MAG TPA: CDP-alcohol phosphatidyltransferase family protein, partial [Gemmatimonadales bacterium]|nr:CDP-alcohol phosphatidyltransferase family protein [Gemmatimonadales bacterium]